MKKYKNYNDEDIILAVKESLSKAQALVKLGLVPRGGNYRVLTNAIKRLNLDISHFTGQGWAKGSESKSKKPLEFYLVENKLVNSYSLKLRLLKEKYFDYKCYSCNLSNWLDKPIPLELEHIDGNHENNLLKNLTLLCPNCHALTPTYRSKNRRK